MSLIKMVRNISTLNLGTSFTSSKYKRKFTNELACGEILQHFSSERVNHTKLIEIPKEVLDNQDTLLNPEKISYNKIVFQKSLKESYEILNRIQPSSHSFIIDISKILNSAMLLISHSHGIGNYSSGGYSPDIFNIINSLVRKLPDDFNKQGLVLRNCHDLLNAIVVSDKNNKLPSKNVSKISKKSNIPYSNNENFYESSLINKSCQDISKKSTHLRDSNKIKNDGEKSFLYLKKMLNLLIHGKLAKPCPVIFGPYIQFFLNRNDIEVAVCETEKIFNKHKVLTKRIEILVHILEQLKVTSSDSDKRNKLQSLLDRCLDVIILSRGYRQMNVDILNACIDTKNIEHAVKILKSSGKKFAPLGIERMCNYYVRDQKSESLLILFKISQHCKVIDRSYIAESLINVYFVNKDAESAMNLYEMMLEQNLRPSRIFMTKISKINSLIDRGS